MAGRVLHDVGQHAALRALAGLREDSPPIRRDRAERETQLIRDQLVVCATDGQLEQPPLLPAERLGLGVPLDNPTPGLASSRHVDPSCSPPRATHIAGWTRAAADVKVAYAKKRI